MAKAKEFRSFRLIYTSNYYSDYDYFLFLLSLLFFVGFYYFTRARKEKKKEQKGEDCEVFGREKMKENE